MTDDGLRPLQAPRRNQYFSGELLDFADLQLEQNYGIEHRRLLARRTVRIGVLRGLAVAAAADGTLNIAPGVALDGWGRVIVVPTACSGIDLAQRTDGESPTGDRLTGGSATVY